MKKGFILACYNRVDDLMTHLDLFKFCPFDHQVIVAGTMDWPTKYYEDLKPYHFIRIDGHGHAIGPLLSCIEGVRKAKQIGLDVVCYRNADDWLFNYKFEEENFQKMKEGYICGGYNWLNAGAYHDITLNQVYLHVNQFMATSSDAEQYFLRSPKDFLCEFKMARWIKRTCSDISKQFYRLPGREQEPGIGYMREDIPGAFQGKGMSIPEGFWEQLEKNNRFYNEKWQLLGHHDNPSRLLCWRRIRHFVPYAKTLEKEKHFARWLRACREKLPWNLDPPEELPSPPKPMQKPKNIGKKIFLGK